MHSRECVCFAKKKPMTRNSKSCIWPKSWQMMLEFLTQTLPAWFHCQGLSKSLFRITQVLPYP